MSRALYNEIDPDAAAILRALIEDDVIAPGDVVTTSIKDLTPNDLRGYTQAHFFAGGGLWSVAARLAGWPDDRPLWTGSCPCQPFSAAGKGGGVDDPRHLWPDFFRLIRACRPPVVMGEQVAGAPGYGWLDGVLTDLEGEDYAGGALDIPACAVDAPHIRQRLYWVAVEGGGWRPGAATLEHAAGDGRREGFAGSEAARYGRELAATDRRCAGADAEGVTLGDAFGSGLEGQPRHVDGGDGRPGEAGSVAEADGGSIDVADAGSGSLRNFGRAPAAGTSLEVSGEVREQRIRANAGTAGDGRNGSFWSDAEWLACHDGKARRTKPGLRLLVDGMPGRVGLWRVAGNAIVAPLAAEVIRAFMETDGRAAA
jgi:DNA (cytosine-5)-methyltransferase 1